VKDFKNSVLNALTHSGPGYETGVEPGKRQREVAFRIRAELVCCHIYDDVQKEAARLKKEGVPGPHQAAIGRAVIRGDWHDICYWGEAAAQIAEGRCPGYETQPNICQCPCEGCKNNCSAHIEGEDRGLSGD
jgi:hypothetical protein